MRALSEAREQSKYARRQLEEQIRTATEMREKAESCETKDLAINKSLRVINTEFNSVYSQYDSFMRDKTHAQDGSHNTQDDSLTQCSSSAQDGCHTSDDISKSRGACSKRNNENISDAEDDVIYVATKYCPEEGKIKPCYIYIYSYF